MFISPACFVSMRLFHHHASTHVPSSNQSWRSGKWTSYRWFSYLETSSQWSGIFQPWSWWNQRVSTTYPPNGPKVKLADFGCATLAPEGVMLEERRLWKKTDDSCGMILPFTGWISSPYPWYLVNWLYNHSNGWYYGAYLVTYDYIWLVDGLEHLDYCSIYGE